MFPKKSRRTARDASSIRLIQLPYIRQGKRDRWPRARAHLRERRGYGGQKYPLQREFAKTTKKQTLKLKCKVCGYMRHKDGIRLRKLVIA